MSADILIREAALGDMPEILHQRRAMYEDMGCGDPEALEAMVASARVW